MSNTTSNCSYEPMEYLAEKMIVVGIFGTSISLAGLGLNGLAAYLLGRLLWRNPSALLYLFTLALLDVVFMLEYIMIFSAQIFFDYFHSLQLYLWWNWWLRVAFALARIIQTASTYLLVAASIERFMDVGGSFNRRRIHHCHTTQRLWVIAGVMIFATLFRGISYWELAIVSQPDCDGFAAYKVTKSSIANTDSYEIFSFYVVTVGQILLPFCLLLCLNLLIILKIRVALRRQSTVYKRQSAWQCENKEKNLRAATKMLLSVISTYLLSNVLNVVITTFEYIDMDWLLSNDQFYTFSVDCINLLYVITSTTRLFIYLGCSEKIRQELCQLLNLGAKRAPQYSQVRQSLAYGRKSTSDLKIEILHDLNWLFSYYGEETFV